MRMSSTILYYPLILLIIIQYETLQTLVHTTLARTFVHPLASIEMIKPTLFTFLLDTYTHL